MQIGDLIILICIVLTELLIIVNKKHVENKWMVFDNELNKNLVLSADIYDIPLFIFWNEKKNIIFTYIDLDFFLIIRTYQDGHKRM